MRDETGLPVVIVAGLHSEARRQVVEHLLRLVPGSVALHHDLSSAADGTVLRQVRDAFGELARGDTLHRLAPLPSPALATHRQHTPPRHSTDRHRDRP